MVQNGRVTIPERELAMSFEGGYNSYSGITGLAPTCSKPFPESLGRIL